MLVDDGSHDGTAEIARRVVPDESLLKIVRTADNPIGLGPARNFGFKHITGSYYWCIDADDWILPNALDSIFEKMQTEPDCIYVNVQSGKEPKSAHPQNLFQLACTEVGVWAKVFKRHCWADFPDYIPEDVVPHFLMLDKVQRFEVVDQPCYFYNRENPSAISRTFDYLAAHPSNMLQLIADEVLEKRALKPEWLGGIVKNLGDMIGLKSKLRNNMVKMAWWRKLTTEYRNFACGIFVH